jgi:NAD(P)-dependent dehydrogenase (short-subunit alcohol dehydrogenase family)
VSAPPDGAPDARVAVVTGAGSGIGKEVARGLAASGYTTVVVGRGADRMAAVSKELAAATGNSRVESVAVSDLAVVAEMKQLATTLLERYPEIHVLVNNAGAFLARRELTSDGIERTFALNVLAPFALTTLLADRMRVSAPARVVEVSSAAHHGATVDLEDLENSRQYHGFRVYGQSKLELILLTREFARRLAGTGVVVNAVHPGFIRSGFGENNRGGVGFGMRVVKSVFARSVQYGARNVLYVATDAGAASISGEYFSGRHVELASPRSYDREVARRLYDICRERTGTPELPLPGPADPSTASRGVP